jgi:hypothetical protein
MEIGLGSEATCFLWKLVHHLLPTEDRLSNIPPNNSSNCKLCPAPIMSDLTHCFFNCISTKEIGGKLLITIAHFDSSVTPDKLLRLEFQADGSQEMPLVWITAQTLLYLWTVRCTGKIVDSNQCRANLESKNLSPERKQISKRVHYSKRILQITCNIINKIH